MITAKAFLNRIKWGKGENPEEYEIAYLDRVLGTEKRIWYTEINEMSANFFSIEAAEVPLHRITRIFRNGKVVWERKRKEE